MREKHKTWSIAIALIFALAFLVPSLGMSATALAEPSVTIDFYDNGDLEVTTGDADDIDEDQATVWAEIDTVDSDFDFDDYEIMERGFFYSYDQDDLDGVEAILISMDDDWDDQVEDWNGFYEEADFDEKDETEFWADLRNLDEDDEETWFYMAYIEYEDEFGDSYYALGEIEEFDVDEGSGSDVPELITNSATDIKTNLAVLNGELTSFGDGDEITDYGFYYGTSSSPSTKKRWAMMATTWMRATSLTLNSVGWTRTPSITSRLMPELVRELVMAASRTLPPRKALRNNHYFQRVYHRHELLPAEWFLPGHGRGALHKGQPHLSPHSLCRLCHGPD